LAAISRRAPARIEATSRYPSVRRDLSLLVPEAVDWQALADTVRSAGGPALREVRLFDRYVGKGIEAGFKSLTMGLILQKESRTLTEHEVEEAVAHVTAALDRLHGVRIRG